MPVCLRACVPVSRVREYAELQSFPGAATNRVLILDRSEFRILMCIQTCSIVGKKKLPLYTSLSYNLGTGLLRMSTLFPYPGEWGKKDALKRALKSLFETGVTKKVMYM